MPEVRLKRREEIASGTMAFFFEKPHGFDFKAGQFARFTLQDPPETDGKGNLRSFTLASAPVEQDLMIATRLRDSAFKRALRSMPLGTKVVMEGPFGSLTLHPDPSRPAAFLAGGIGITPFRSIVVQATREDLPHRLFLFYSNRRPEDAAFLHELEALESENPRLSVLPTLTDSEGPSSSWAGRTGRLDRKMIEEVVGSLDSPVYYLAGPPGLVDAMQRMLSEAGVDPASVRAERFSGY